MYAGMAGRGLTAQAIELKKTDPKAKETGIRDNSDSPELRLPRAPGPLPPQARPLSLLRLRRASPGTPGVILASSIETPRRFSASSRHSDAPLTVHSAGRMLQ